MQAVDVETSQSTGAWRMMPRVFVLSLFLLFLCAVLPRVLYVIQIQTPPFSDMADYDKAAVNFLMGDGLSMSQQYQAYRAPGYPFFLAVLYWIAGHDYLLVSLVQCVLGSLTTVMTALLAWRSFTVIRGRMIVSIAAGAILALSDESIFFCGQMLTETLYAFLFVIWLLLLLDLYKARMPYVVVMGALTAFLMLVRPGAGLFVVLPVCVFSSAGVRFIGGEKTMKKIPLVKWGKKSAVFLVALLITIMPWTVRNWIVTGYFVPISTNGGVNFYIGHNADFDYWSTGAKTTIREQTDLDEVQESRLFTRLGLQFIAENPGKTLLNSVRKIGYLYTTTWKPWPWFNNGRELRFAYGVPIPVWAWCWITIPVVFLGCLACLLRKERVGLLLASVGLQTLTCVITFANSRFRLPLMPIFSVFMAYGLWWLCTLRKTTKTLEQR